MEIGQIANLYMMLLYVYLKAYGEAIADFEDAMKDAGYADIALMSIKQNYQEKIDRVAREASS